MNQRPPISELHGVPPEMRDRLAQMGIRTVDQLIARSLGPHGRMLARELGVDAHQLSLWAARADVAKLAATGQELAKLLGHAGIAAGKELHSRIPPHVQAKATEVGLTAVGEIKKRAPSKTQLESFAARFRKPRE